MKHVNVCDDHEENKYIICDEFGSNVMKYGIDALCAALETLVVQRVRPSDT